MYDKQNLLNIVKNRFPNEWEPDLDESAFRILGSCDSLVEKLHILGATYFTEDIRNKHHGECSGCKLQIRGCNVIHEQTTYEGVWFQEPWGGWLAGMGAGPSACAFVPQLKLHNKKWHHDFGLFYGGSNSGAPWYFKCAIEIDPNYTHKDRRDKDAYRDSIVDYQVVRIYDEIHDEISWFKEIIDIDDDKILKHLANLPDES